MCWYQVQLLDLKQGCGSLSDLGPEGNFITINLLGCWITSTCLQLWQAQLCINWEDKNADSWALDKLQIPLWLRGLMNEVKMQAVAPGVLVPKAFRQLQVCFDQHNLKLPTHSLGLAAEYTREGILSAQSCPGWWTVPPLLVPYPQWSYVSIFPGRLE